MSGLPPTQLPPLSAEYIELEIKCAQHIVDNWPSYDINVRIDSQVILHLNNRIVELEQEIENLRYELLDEIRIMDNWG